MPLNQDRRKDVMYCLVSPNTDSQTQLALARYQLIYSVLGLLLGLFALLSGAYLFILGVTGQTSWSLTIFGNESNIVNAAPGATLFIVGLFLVVVTRFKFKHIQPKN